MSESEVPVELQLDLPSFEGPLDLLLQLVRQQEVDIFEISIAAITRDYLACIERMDELDLEVGGEWLEMAARLMHVKSRTLVPEDEDEDDDEPDPRDELVRRLIEYERFKRYADKLASRPRLDSDVFAPPARLDSYRDETGPPELREADVGALVEAVEQLLERGVDDEPEFVYEMEREQLSLRDVVVDVADRLQSSRKLHFTELFDERPRRNRIVTTFFALLEMTRLEMIELVQSTRPSEGLYLRRAADDVDERAREMELDETG